MRLGTDGEPAQPAPARRARWRWTARTAWAPFAGVYAAYGATFGVIGGGAPLVLRAHGMSLEAIGLIQIIYAPIGLAFLWAPLVDRFKLPGLPHRLGWIGTGMAASCLLLAVLAAATHFPVSLVFVLAMAVSVTMTTTDIALEALVVETVARELRPFVTTAKLVGASLGTMIGVGLATALPDRLGLSAALLLVAGLDAALVLPLAAYPEPPRRTSHKRARREPAHTRLLIRRAFVLGAFYAPAIFLVTVPNLVLLDLKLSLPVVGFFTGTLTTLTGVAMTLAVGAAMTRFVAHRIVAVLTIGVAASALLLSLATSLVSSRLGFAAATTMLLFEGGLGVPIFNVVYRWAEGEHAATDYAVLFGIAFLVSFPARVLAPMLASSVGWTAYFLVSVPPYAAAVYALVRAMRETPERGPAPSAKPA